MIYIDDANIKYGRMIMCHMVADTKQELVDMADAIGVPRKYIQKANTYQEHFDICLAAKRRALALGAKEVTRRELSEFCIKRMPTKQEYERLRKTKKTTV